MAQWISYQQSDSTLQQSVLCQLSLLFSLESLKMSINGSKLVLSLSLLFSKVCCFNFLYKAGLPSTNVWLINCYANLTSTYPLLGFFKWLECLEVGFREVVRGLVSPTSFMEGCVFEFCSLVTIWVILFCCYLSSWFFFSLTIRFFDVCHNLSFVTIWVLHNSSFGTIWVVTLNIKHKVQNRHSYIF